MREDAVKRESVARSRVLSVLRAHRRVVVACAVIVVPLLTLIVAEGVAQMRLAASMSDAAGRLMATLSPEQKALMNLPLESLERFSWHYIPRMRKGLALPTNQKALALDLLKTGLSDAGYNTAQEIMSLELVLIEREANGSMPMVRDPGSYYFVIFGTPSQEQPWGWRVEGHHISANFTIVGGRVEEDVVANTPLFFGSEPAVVQGGPMKGLRPLAGVEDKARALIDALNTGQRAVAILGTDLPTDIFSGNSRPADLAAQLNPIGLSRQPDPIGPEGLPASAMTAQQQQLLRSLVDNYLSRMPDEIAAARAQSIGADFEELRFAWFGALRAEDGPPLVSGFGCDAGDTRWHCITLGYPYYYRVQGPAFLIEYMKTSGNHSHSVWRDLQDGDFGEDLLRAHYAEVPHDGVTLEDRLALR